MSENTTAKEIVDLGWANSWPAETPEVVRNCMELRKKDPTHGQGDQPQSGHDCKAQQGWVQCLECGYKYRYDSSG